jgi:hypothetical protein
MQRSQKSRSGRRCRRKPPNFVEVCVDTSVAALVRAREIWPSCCCWVLPAATSAAATAAAADFFVFRAKTTTAAPAAAACELLRLAHHPPFATTNLTLVANHWTAVPCLVRPTLYYGVWYLRTYVRTCSCLHIPRIFVPVSTPRVQIRGFSFWYRIRLFCGSTTIITFLDLAVQPVLVLIKLNLISVVFGNLGTQGFFFLNFKNINLLN